MYRPVKWDKDANQRALDAAIRKARAAGAELIVTPEGALEGYLENEVRLTTGDKRREMIERFNRIAEPVDGPYVKHFQKVCRELKIYLVLGLLERAGDKTHNSAVVIGPDGRLIGTYRKTHFAQGYKIGDEKGNNPAGYLRGTDYPVFDVAGRKLGVMICFDRRVPKVARELVRNGADFIVNPSYGMKGDCNRGFVSSRAKENHVPVLFVHPYQTVLAAADGALSVDSRPKEGDERTCMVTIE
jgi:predicted amidohydrolase